MAVDVRWSGDALRAIRACGDRADDVARLSLDRIGDAAIEAMVNLTPPGRHRASFRSDRDGDAVQAGTTSPLGSIIERGRRPGAAPNPADLGGRLRGDGAAAQRIGERGTRGKWVVRRASQTMRNGTIQEITADTIRDLGTLRRA